MTPGRKYRPEDILQIVWGRKWLLLVPLALGGLGMAIHSRSLPNIYQSEVVIQVVPQGIPENFVRSTVTTQIGARLNAISQQIRSRARLEGLIVELGLYQSERRNGTMQDAVERMQREIKGPTLSTERRSGASRQRGSASGSFILGFVSPNPEVALKVTERLASMFIEENLRQRTGQAEVTDRFLESQLESTRAELEQQEKRLAEFKRRYAESLPTRTGANTTGLQTTQNQVNSLVEKTVLDRERRLMLERQVADLAALEIVETTEAQVALRRGQPSASAARTTRPSSGNQSRSASAASASTRGGQGVSGGANRSGGRTSAGNTGIGNGRGRQNGGTPRDENDENATAAQRLERAREELNALELRFKPDHPDIGIYRRRIADLERQAEEEALLAPVSAVGVPGGASPAELKRQQQLKALRDEIEMIDRQIVRREEEEKQLRAKLGQYQRWIEEAPVRDTELEVLTRDHDTIEGNYKTLLKKKSDARIATELEHRQVAEQFRIAEPPLLPQRPISPDRPRLVMMGAFSGLGLGLFLAALLEYRDRSLKTDEDVVAALSLPVLAMVPTIVTDGDRRRSKRRLVLTGSAVGIMLLLSLAAWKFQILNRWL
jgi:succinoglycan biosynthesis transport protein ExoP